MSEEKPLELTPEMRVSACETLDSLYDILRDIGEIRGTKHIYTGEQLVGLIQSTVLLRKHGPGAVETGLQYITNALHIRDKVRELIAKLPPAE